MGDIDSRMLFLILKERGEWWRGRACGGVCAVVAWARVRWWLLAVACGGARAVVAVGGGVRWRAVVAVGVDARVTDVRW